jgi:glycogen debranching enzyme
VNTPTSNPGHCLWSGIVPDEYAGAVVERLVSDELFSGFGIRTLGSAAGRYNPASYHNGTVWPHDSVLVAAGIARYGFAEEAGRVLAGLLDAATAFGGRLPELFCGYPADAVPVPVPYPTSCSPQAWAAAVPFQILTTALGLQADLDEDRFTAGPVLPLVGDVRIDDLRCGPHRLSLVSEGGEVAVAGLFTS